MTVMEVAAILGISKHCVYRAVRDKSLPAIKLGSRVLVLREPLEKLLEPTKP